MLNAFPEIGTIYAQFLWVESGTVIKMSPGF